MKVYDRLEDYPKLAGERAFKDAIQRLKDTCGLSHEMANTVVRVFAKELADSLVQNKIIDIPHLGSIYYFNKLHSQGISFRVSPEFKAIRNKGGTDENNFIRAVEKSSIRSTRRDENGIDSGE
jgi:nucleoid DNA-binding protein